VSIYVLGTNQISSNLSKKKFVVSIYGLGNVGGPLAAAWLRTGVKIIGVDISQKLLSEIKCGTSHKKEPFISQTFTTALKKGKLTLTSKGINASKKTDIKIIAVPVGIKQNKIDLSALISASTDVAKGLKKKDVVIICPSLPPGTTRNLVLPILEKFSHLQGKRDFYLIYNPERIFEGRALEDIEKNYPAIVSGLDKKSLELGEKLLKMISKKGALKMSSLENAEAEKIFEGVYRDVNIALANELAEFCEKLGVDYWEARKGANSQPYCHLHYPGTGVGGLCIPVYPQFVIKSASKIGKRMKIIEFSRKKNDFMPKKCVIDALELLKKNKIKFKDSKISVLGLGFRGEVTDSRLSPTFTVVTEFLKKGFEVAVHDPYIFQDKNLPVKASLSKELKTVVKGASLIFISTDHKMYSKLNKKLLSGANKPLLIYDGRNILNKKNFKNSTVLTIGTRL